MKDDAGVVHSGGTSRGPTPDLPVVSFLPLAGGDYPARCGFFERVVTFHSGECAGDRTVENAIQTNAASDRRAVRCAFLAGTAWFW